MKGIIKVTNVSAADSKALWEWRNHPEVRRYFFDSEVVPWQKHEAWFAGKLRDPGTKIYIAEMGGKKVGVIRFDRGIREVSVSVNLNPDFFGRGLGAHIIEKGTEKFFEETRSKKTVTARVKNENIASRKAFMKAGYKVFSEDGYVTVLNRRYKEKYGNKRV